MSNEKLALNNLSAVYPSEFSMMEILEVYSLYAHTYYVIETIHPFWSINQIELFYGWTVVLDL